MNPETPKPEAVSLLPCPCCASTDLVPPPKHWSDGVVYCKNCGLRGASPTAWNLRAYYAPQTPAGGEAKLREALERARSDLHLVLLHGDVVGMHAEARKAANRIDAALSTVSAPAPSVPSKSTKTLSDDDIVPVSRAILAAAARWIRDHDGDDSNTYRAIVLAALRPVQDGEVGGIRSAVTTIIARCEALEDEAFDNLASITANGHDKTHEEGYWRGQKSTAKSVRRELHDLTRDSRP